MNEQQKELIKLLSNIEKKSKDEWINSIADFLGYEVARNPIDPQSSWEMLVHEDFEAGEQAVIAMMVDDKLNIKTNVREIRKRYEQVVELRQILGATYNVPLAAFIGKGRIVIYRIDGGNRDERLDLSCDSIERVSLYATYFIKRLKKENIQLVEDEFGFGYIIQGLDDLFKRELSTRFNHMIELYRKKFAEVIVADNDLRQPLRSLVIGDAQSLIRNQKLAEMVEHPSFKIAVGCVVDTMILRQLLRRFLEAYHGVDSFNVQDDLRDLGLGVGEGRMEEVLNQIASIYWKNIDDVKLKKAVQKERKANIQMNFDLFSEEEEEVTAHVKINEEHKQTYPMIYERLRHQFQLAYGGDLFAGSVAEVANIIEDRINKKYPGLIVKLWADIASNQYNFRYEDLPPEFLQHQYEASMSRTIQIGWDEEGSPIIFYGDDLLEQKTKGAYYTDSRLVTYMVQQSIAPIFEKRVESLRIALKKNNELEARLALDHILDIKVVDITCGGGSFLRGAFYWLGENQKQIARLLEQYEVSNKFISDYPMFISSPEGICEWEKHVLTNMIYGVDIDYKALIICSQTLTLSALRNWRAGTNFAQLIGLTLIHQNALMTPVPFNERAKTFEPYRESIANLIRLRNKARMNSEDSVRKEIELLNYELQSKFKPKARELFGDYVETLHVEVFELKFPEVFFNSDGSWNNTGGFDIALGNPPWEIWKPNAEEFFETYEPTYRKAKKQSKLQIQKELYEKHSNLEERWNDLQDKYAVGSKFFLDPQFYEYQRWKVEGKFTGGDLNLYKLALERFYQLLKLEGKANILVPGNIVTDRGATGLRHLLFKNANVTEVLCFTNKKKIFPAVGELQKFTLLSFNKVKPNGDYVFKAFFYRTSLEDLINDELKIRYPISLAEQVSPSILTLLEFRTIEEMALTKKLYKFPMIAEEHPSWKMSVTTELHSSGQSNMFQTEKTAIKRLGGRHINQYLTTLPGDSFVEEKQFEEFWLNREKYRSNNGLKVHLGTHQYYRLAFRDTARATDKRTVIASILPKGVTSVDTLKIAQPFEYVISKDGEVCSEKLYDNMELLVMVGLLNSFTVDFLMRRKVDKHVSGFLMNQMPIPRITHGDKYFEEIMEKVARLVCTSIEFDELALEVGMQGYQDGIVDKELRQIIQNQIDAYVADLYNLTREELIYILSTFESPSYKEEMRRIAQGVIEAFDELKREGEIICPM